MSHLLLVGHTHSCKLTLGNDCAVRPSVTIRLDTSQVGKRDSARVWVVVVAVRRTGGRRYLWIESTVTAVTATLKKVRKKTSRTTASHPLAGRAAPINSAPAPPAWWAPSRARDVPIAAPC